MTGVFKESCYIRQKPMIEAEGRAGSKCFLLVLQCTDFLLVWTQVYGVPCSELAERTVSLDGLRFHADF